MAFYETVFIARQDLTNGQVEELATTMAGFVNDNGATVTNTEFWGLRQLAYRINKNRKGHYICFHIDGAAAAKDELERNLRLNEDVLRFLSTAMEEKPEGQTIMMKNKEGNA
jgi:small subunit ribosomal protein S6